MENRLELASLDLPPVLETKQENGWLVLTFEGQHAELPPPGSGMGKPRFKFRNWKSSDEISNK